MYCAINTNKTPQGQDLPSFTFIFPLLNIVQLNISFLFCVTTRQFTPVLNIYIAHTASSMSTIQLRTLLLSLFLKVDENICRPHTSPSHISSVGEISALAFSWSKGEKLALCIISFYPPRFSACIKLSVCNKTELCYYQTTVYSWH